MRLFNIFSYVTIFVVLLSSHMSYSKINSSEIEKKTAEIQIRHIIDPILEKYCHDQCKLMNVIVSIDLATNDALSPGFDDFESKRESDFAPASAKVKMLIDDKVGPVSRGKLLDLIQQYLDTLEYPVKVDVQLTHFPAPQGSEKHISELKEKVSKQFMDIIGEVIHQFCPDQCLLVNYDLQTDIVNPEETQYGSVGEFIQDGDSALKIKDISATILMDIDLTQEEQANILEMAKLKTNLFKHVSITSKAIKFPHPSDLKRGLASSTTADLNKNTKTASTNSETNSKNESNLKQERIERVEKIERVENGDAVQAELQKFKVYGLIFSASIFALLIFIALSIFRPIDSGKGSTVHRVIQSLTSDPVDSTSLPSLISSTPQEGSHSLSKRYEIESLREELTSIYAQQPKVAKQVFTRLLTEEGVEATAQCIHLFGEGIVVDMLRDPSLQADLNELLEFYAKNPIEMDDNTKINILRRLHNRTVAGKLLVLGSRSSSLFDFLSEMDGIQILELIRTESLTVKSIVLTQCDSQKRSIVYSQMNPDIRMKLLTELTRIDYLPRDYIFNVATALKRKKKDNPKLNTEALPGSEVLVSLLERTGQDLQRTVVKSLEASNPESARTVKGKLVSIDTLRYLRDGQLLEVVLNLKHEELIQFLKGTSSEIRSVIFSKAPKELSIELEEELAQLVSVTRESYQAMERKVLNRMKIMANEGQINLIETNDRMFSDAAHQSAFIQTLSNEEVEERKEGAAW